MMFPLLSLVALLPLAAAWPSDLAHIISATHWAPCYFNTTAPVLLDGIATMRGLGTRAIKLALDDPITNYPFNSPSWPTSSSSVLALAKHPYYNSALADPTFDIYSLITYSQGVVGFCSGDKYDAAAAAADTSQFRELTEYLLSSFPTKTFIVDSWENDWGK